MGERYRYNVTLCVIAGMIAGALIVPAWAGTIPGELRDYRNLPVPDVWTSCSMPGTNFYARSTSTSSASESMGTFLLGSSLAVGAGTYSQGTAEKNGYPLLYRKDILVPASDPTEYAVLRYNPTACCFGTEPFDAPHTSYAQSFRARGNNLVSVGVRAVYPVSGQVMVEVLEGELPSAHPMQPTRRLTISNGNIQSAYWSAGEIPTVAGRVYTVRFTLSGGGVFTLRRQAVRKQMRSEIPDGRTWIDDIPTDQSLEVTINEDDAGLINTVGCIRPNNMCYISSAGQTFLAKGTSLLAITWLTDESLTDQWAINLYEVSDSVKKQICPTKYAARSGSQGNAGRSIITFAPGEAPTTPGKTYYVTFGHRLTSTGPMRIYNAADSEYTGGTGYVYGTALSSDLALGIYEESAPGILDRPIINIDNIRVDTITASSAVIQWSTNIASDSTVEYGQITPYISSIYESTQTQDHTLTLSGLQANTLYHIRACSRASGAKEAVSQDITFVTAADGSNLLTDADFESGLGGWTAFGPCAVAAIGSGGPSGAGPHNGSWALSGSAAVDVERGGVYQRVSAIPGAVYSLSVWGWTYTDKADSADEAHCCAIRIGIDPTGGTDPAGSSVRWSPYTYSHASYSQLQLTAEAASDHITIFLYGGYTGSESIISPCVFAFDDAVLTSQASSQPSEVALARALADCPDGSEVTIPNVVCTATSSQAGACYVQGIGRVNGLRIETSDAMVVGENVTVSGTMQTHENQERYLAGASVISRSGSTIVAPLGIRLSSAGGGALGQYCAGVAGGSGPYNVGMLLRCAGQVKAIGSGFIYINDNSVPGNGLKIDTAGLTRTFIEGQTISAAGILQLEGVNGSAVPILNPRTDADIYIYL